MNDFKDLDLDYFAPRKPAEPEAKPEKTEVGDAPTADESAEPAERRRKPKPSRRELLNMRLSVLSVGVMVILFALMTLYLLLFPRSTVSQIETETLRNSRNSLLHRIFPARLRRTSPHGLTIPCRTTTALRI